MKIDINELSEAWKQAIDSDVIKAATKDWDEYSSSVQALIEAEAKKRGLLKKIIYLGGEKTAQSKAAFPNIKINDKSRKAKKGKIQIAIGIVTCILLLLTICSSFWELYLNFYIINNEELLKQIGYSPQDFDVNFFLGIKLVFLTYGFVSLLLYLTFICLKKQKLSKILFLFFLLYSVIDAYLNITNLSQEERIRGLTIGAWILQIVVWLPKYSCELGLLIQGYLGISKWNKNKQHIKKNYEGDKEADTTKCFQPIRNVYSNNYKIVSTPTVTYIDKELNKAAHHKYEPCVMPESINNQSEKRTKIDIEIKSKTELVPIMSGRLEKCANCTRTIGKLEHSYDYKENIICSRCYHKLKPE